MKHTGTDPDIRVIFEDEYLLVIDKPVNVLSQEDYTGDPDVVRLCKKFLAGNRIGQTTPYLGLVHRLDRPVSGLMVLAKTPGAAKRLAKQMRERTIQKTYWAVTEGSPPPNGVLTHHLLKDRDRNIVQVASPGRRKTKKAVLSFETMARSGGLNLLSVHLQTGRPHQIRVQLAHESYPVWGDYKYGSDQADGRNIALRSMALTLAHPIHPNEEIRFQLEAPSVKPWINFTGPNR